MCVSGLCCCWDYIYHPAFAVARCLQAFFSAVLTTRDFLIPVTHPPPPPFVYCPFHYISPPILFPRRYLPWELANTEGVLLSQYPGSLGGGAIADVLTGAYNPGGRLPFTVYTNFR